MNYFFIETQSYLEEWKMKGPFNPDVMAGMIIAGHMLLSVLNTNQYSFAVTNQDVDDILEVNSIETIGPNYVLQIAILEENTYHMPGAGMYGIWVFNSEDDEGNLYWDLVEVQNMDEFMQGFITMCNAFKVDFREYILSLPFDSDGIEYDLPEYDLETYFEEETEDFLDSPVYERDDLDG